MNLVAFEKRILDKELLVSRKSIEKRVKELANQISLDYEGRDPVLIGVINCGHRFDFNTYYAGSRT
jgi:hypoxanthine-guanine phosphoribosyltransferase